MHLASRYIQAADEKQQKQRRGGDALGGRATDLGPIRVQEVYAGKSAQLCPMGARVVILAEKMRGKRTRAFRMPGV